MFKIFTSFAAESSFQKHRLILTSKDYQAPDEYSLKRIVRTFRGQDQETRSQIAFATIVKKIYSSDSKQNWIYLLKNLIIFDKVVQQNCFLHEISQLSLESIQNYTQKNVQAKYFKSEKILKKYWNIIKQKARILSGSKNVLSYGRSQRSEFLQNLRQNELYKQSTSLQWMFQMYFQFINLLQVNNQEAILIKNILSVKAKLIRQQLYQSKLLHYLHLQILYKLLAIYTSQMLCIRSFVFKFSNDKDVASLTQNQVSRWKKTINNFNSYSLKIIYYVERHKHVKGFQIVNYQELKPFQNLDIIGILDKFIDQKKQESETIIRDLGPMNLQSGTIQVQKKPHSNSLNDKTLAARKILTNVLNKKNEQNNSFQNYQSFYSNLFPPKQILTLDLIDQLRKNQLNNQTQEDDQSIYNFFNRQSCIYNYRQSDLSVRSQFQFIPPSKMIENQCHKEEKSDIFILRSLDHDFSNIFSSLPLVWNK